MFKNASLFVMAYVIATIATPVVVPLNVIRKAYRKESVSQYLKDCAIGFDQAGGSVLYQQENFTISSYTYFLCNYKKNKYACWFMWFIDSIFGNNHCLKSYHKEIKKDKQDLQNFTKDI